MTDSNNCLESRPQGPAPKHCCQGGLECPEPTSLVLLQAGAQRQQHQVRTDCGLGPGKSLLAPK